MNANPHDDDNPWNWTTSKKIGEMEEWYVKGGSGKTKKYFLQVKEGDLVFGYNTGNQRQLVALAEITMERHKNDKEEEVIGVTKIKDLKKTISIQQVRQNQLFKDKFSEDIKLRGTIIQLSKDEFYELLRMI